MKKSTLENKLYDEDLSLCQLLELREQMKKFDFKKDDFEYADELINEQYELLIEDILEGTKTVSNVKGYLGVIKIKLKDYNIDFSKIDYILDNIHKLKKQPEKKEKTHGLLGAIFKGLFLGLSSNKTDSKNIDSGYEPYQFEETELEEDDYYKEDVD